ncbi:bacterial type IV pilus assembly (PilZ) protein-like protein [Phaeobacter inhibens]|nr:bacterial type IV pilus assembly (PilZ) protein-like protein [Phaeobacter inhibens]AUQ82722.1 bacterial type IV pilus assembly (PilZ) protein-like protein [Phaeobacter inhibens]AUQ90483.1 bacterial type IV pilus assembly (PilZ) protein-like protein [Phaeobacter inhibens]
MVYIQLLFRLPASSDPDLQQGRRPAQRRPSRMWGVSLFALLIVTSFFLGAEPLAARECRVFNKLMTLTLASEEMLNYLRTGSNSRAVQELERFLSNTTKTELHRGMQREELNELSKATHNLIAQQHSLLRVLSIKDRRTAERTSVKLFARETLAAYRRELARMPCQNAHKKGTTDGNLGALPALGQISSTTAAAGSLGLVALGALCFILFERRMTTLKRRRKRHTCNLDCHLLYAEEEAEATLLDISQEGAKIKSDVICAVGDKISLKLPKDAPQVDLSGQVQWCNANYFGIQFKDRLPRDVVKTLAGFRRAPSPAKRGFARGDTPPDLETNSAVSG